jgi:oligopeptide transport system substrate-binding protein
MLEGLARMQEGGVIEEGSGLAESWDISEDGLVYTFKLRDALWSDGTAITAEDFVYSWKRALKPETASKAAYLLYPIKGGEAYSKGEGSESDVAVEAVDEKTLKVTLERPTPYFLSLTAYTAYMPVKKEFYESHKENFANGVDSMICSGPFVIKTWDQEQRIILEKNENYWDKENVNIDRIEYDMIVDLNTPINLYETNELDLIGVPTEYLAKYRTSSEFLNLPRASSWYFEFNCDNEFFSNLKIRKAFSMAVNRTVFVDTILANGSIVAGGLVPSAMPGLESKEGDFRSQSGQYMEDQGTMGDAAIEEANRLLDEGLKEVGKTRKELADSVYYLSEDGDHSKKLAQVFQQMWKQNLGIELPIESVTFKLKLDKEQKGDFAIALAGWNADYNDPMTYLDLWISDSAQNKARWSNEEYDLLIEKATNTTGDERMQAMIDAEKILMEEMPVAPIYYKASNIVQRDYLKNVLKFPVGITYEYKWADIVR